MRPRDKLRAWWRKSEDDLVTFWPLGQQTVGGASDDG